MEIPSLLEQALLEAIDLGQGQFGWRGIASLLSTVSVPRDPDMMEALQVMRERGLVSREVKLDSPKDRWALTDAGRTLLDWYRLRDRSLESE